MREREGGASTSRRAGAGQLLPDARKPTYDQMGALSDVGQNHLPQMLATALSLAQITEPSTQGVRTARLQILQAFPALDPAAVTENTLLAQYSGYATSAEGAGGGRPVDTFFAVKLAPDEGPWKGVPMHMISGKGLNEARRGVNWHLKGLPPKLAKLLGVAPGTPGIVKLELAPEVALTVSAGDVSKQLPLNDQIASMSPYARMLVRAPRDEDDVVLAGWREAEGGWTVDAIHGAQTEGAALPSYAPGSQPRELLDKVGIPWPA